jgi:hypothetical protein
VAKLTSVLHDLQAEATAARVRVTGEHHVSNHHQTHHPRAMHHVCQEADAAIAAINAGAGEEKELLAECREMGICVTPHLLVLPPVRYPFSFSSLVLCSQNSTHSAGST